MERHFNPILTVWWTKTTCPILNLLAASLEKLSQTGNSLMHTLQGKMNESLRENDILAAATVILTVPSIRYLVWWQCFLFLDVFHGFDSLWRTLWSVYRQPSWVVRLPHGSQYFIRGTYGRLIKFIFLLSLITKWGLKKVLGLSYFREITLALR